MARERPDLVLTDLAMPGLDGLGLTRRLKAHPATCGIPVVMMSALGGCEDASAAGCDGFLPKPFELDALIQAVRHHVADAAPA
jgi:CheY-like chemotaxis protein